MTISAGEPAQEPILALLHPGDIFGELAMLDESPRDHHAEAVEDTVLCALNRDPDGIAGGTRKAPASLGPSGAMTATLSAHVGPPGVSLVRGEAAVNLRCA